MKKETKRPIRSTAKLTPNKKSVKAAPAKKSKFY